jgi:hypothetical protein
MRHCLISYEVHKQQIGQIIGFKGQAFNDTIEWLLAESDVKRGGEGK